MSNNYLSRLESPAVQGYISMLQGIINRMAGNSASCKTWTVTLVTAMLVLLVDKQIQLPNPLLCLIPVVLLYLLDCYYLGLERITISIQEEFFSSLSKETADYIDLLYKVDERGQIGAQLYNMLKAIFSISTMPFYLLVASIVLYLIWGISV